MADDEHKPAEPPKGNLVSRGKGYEIYRYMRGDFQVIRIFGRGSGDVLQTLRQKVFKENKSTALDVASLADPQLPFIRELTLTGRRLRNQGKYLVLLNARGKIRDLIRSTADEKLIPFVLSEGMLEGSAATFSSRLAAAGDVLRKIQTKLQSDPAWRMSDREGLWLCPYCASVQDHIVLRGRGVPTETKRELIAIHLLEECSPFRKNQSIRPVPELGQILKEVNREKLIASKESASLLVSRMVEMQEQVQEAAELRHSVEVASQRQRRLLPARAPDIDGCAFGLGYRPCQTVGGDFYDFVEIPEGKLGVFIGDVSGHGVEAAIVMGMAKKIIQIHMRSSGEPDEAMKLANGDIYPDLDRRTFVTAFAGIIDPEGKTFTFARAGHNPAILYNPDRTPDFQRLEIAGMALGM
ncbi:MAG: PP2C family protein-serine/threonine phosphatase, partial [Planctomycetota bacterium]